MIECGTSILYVSVICSFFLLNNILLMDLPLVFFYSLSEGHLVCPVFTMMKKMGINIHAQVFWWTYKFLFLLRSRIAGSYVKYVFKFLKCPNFIPKWLYHFVFLPKLYESFICILVSTCYCQIFLFNFGHYNRCMVIIGRQYLIVASICISLTTK